MGLKDLEILLDNPWCTYFEGQTINGQVRVTVDSPKKVRGIVIRFLGEAETRWSETRTRTDSKGKTHTETVWYGAQEEYFRSYAQLLGTKSGPTIELPTGIHTYSFSCALPPTLPSAFEGEYGHIRYTVKVTLDRPWRFDQEAKMAFTVISPIDLNLKPQLRAPSVLSLEKTFYCFCCASGPLQAVFSLPVTGFVSGQNIPIAIDIDNASNVDVNRIRVTLRKTTIFKESRNSKWVTEDMATLCTEPIQAGKAKNWNETFNLPPVAPSNLANCNIIDLNYELRFECCVSGAHKDLEGTIPITIGTVPLVAMGNFSYNTNIPLVPMAPSAPDVPIAPSAPELTKGDLGFSSTLYPSVPEPTFNESEYRGKIADKSDSEHTRMTTTHFAPRYPTYNAFALPTLPNSKQK